MVTPCTFVLSLFLSCIFCCWCWIWLHYSTLLCDCKTLRFHDQCTKSYLKDNCNLKAVIAKRKLRSLRLYFKYARYIRPGKIRLFEVMAFNGSFWNPIESPMHGLGLDTCGLRPDLGFALALGAKAPAWSSLDLVLVLRGGTSCVNTNVQESWATAKMTADAPYVWVPLKFSRVPEYAHGYFCRNFKQGFVPIDPINVRTKFEVRSFTGSWDNKG